MWMIGHKYSCGKDFSSHWVVQRIPNPLSTLFWFGIGYMSTYRLLHFWLTHFIKCKHRKTPEPNKFDKRFEIWCPTRCSAYTDNGLTLSDNAPYQENYESGIFTINGYIYCRVPARRGLQRTAQAATRHGARDPLVCPQVDQTYRGASKNKQTR